MSLKKEKRIDKGTSVDQQKFFLQFVWESHVSFSGLKRS